MIGFTILYKCNNCGVVTNLLAVNCYSCGNRLITKPVLEVNENGKVQGKDELQVFRTSGEGEER